MVSDRAMRSPPMQFDTTLDRAGLALGAGGVMGGFVVLGLVLLGGQRDPLSLVVALVLGTVFSVLGMTAIAGPIWLALHLAGCRRARHAAMVGAFVALAIFVGGQTYGFGLFTAPESDAGTVLMRWISALATSGILAAIAAGIGAAMWRIAYRRVL